MGRNPLRRLALTLVKIALSVGILAFLIVRAAKESAFEDLTRQSKHWGLLAAAAGVCFAAVVLTLIRWFWLVRALELPFRLHEALRLGFLGYLFNLAPMGIVGGDLLKAVMLARRQPGRRAEAVASVLMDRLLGLYVLFLVASAAIFLTGLWRTDVPSVRIACQTAMGLTVAGTVFMAVLLLPDATRGRSTEWFGRLPYVGHSLKRLIEAVRMYRLKLPTLAAAFVASIAIHSLFSVGVYLVACGLYEHVHSVGMHFVIIPLSAATGVLPITMGPFEGVLALLYKGIPLPGAPAEVAANLFGQGVAVALAYRIITVLIAAVGACYYLGSRQEVAEVVHEAELAET